MKKNLILLGMLFASGAITTFRAQTEREREEIIKNYDLSLLKQMAVNSAEKENREKKEAVEFAKKNNIPIIIESKDVAKKELMRIDNGIPIYYSTDNVNAAKSTRANYLNRGGALGLNLNGENMIVNVWDGGAIRTNHTEFGTRVTVKDNASFGSILGSNHATHVGGTIGSTGVNSQSKGMAPHSTIGSYDWTNDESEMTSAASTGLLLSNHSYGYNANNLPDWYFGAYLQDSKDWDEILFNAPFYLAVKAAGNDGTNFVPGSNTNRLNESPMGGSTDLYDKLTGAATSKNVLVVANAQDANIDSSGNLVSVTINNTSSQGPTDDLRIKPDIAGNGTTVFSPVAFNQQDVSSTNSYDSYTGTSMASPNVTGTLTLVQQHHKNVQNRYMLGAELKGLALHTADDAGVTGPDAMFGWGLLNAKKMVEVVNAKGSASLIENKTLNNTAKEILTINSNGTNPLTVSISWYDRGGSVQSSSELNNSNSKRLVNNLDLKVTSKSDNTVYRPWVMTSRSTNTKAENNNDNFERVDLGIVPAGEYIVEVSHKGSLTGGNQNYTLIATGLSGNTIPNPQCNAPSNLANSNISQSAATVTWTASTSANTGYTLEYKANSANAWTAAYTGTATTYNLTGLAAGTAYSWRVKTNCTASLSSSFVSANFSTLGTPVNCNAPTNLANVTVNNSTATVTWAASSSQNTGYTVEYKTASASTWINAGNTTATTYNFTGLSASTSYNWRVRTNCSSTLTSDFVTGAFTTTANPSTSCSEAFENNNTISSAYNAVLNTDYSAAIGVAGDVDYYKVNIPAGTHTVSLTNLSHDIDLRIQNASGTTLASSQNSGTSNEQISANFAGGTYYFRVYPYSGYDPNTCYKFTVRNSAGNSIYAASPVTSGLIDNAKPINVYPNPARNEVKVKLHIKDKSKAVISIFDLNGKNVITKQGENGENIINVSQLPAGNYIVKVDDGVEVNTVKFIKL